MALTKISSGIISSVSGTKIVDGTLTGTKLSDSTVPGTKLNKTLLPSGTVVQTMSFRSTTSDITISSSTSAIASSNITTQGNTKLILWVHSGQIQRTVNQPNTNPGLQIMVDGVNVGTDNDHSWYGAGGAERVFLLNQGVSGTLGAGNHTIVINGTVYNGTCTFNFQGLARSVYATVFEVIV